MTHRSEKPIRRALAALLITVLLFGLSGCTPKEEPPVDPAPAPDPVPRNTDSGTVLCLSSSLEIPLSFIEEKTGFLPSSLLYTSTTSVAVSCLLDGTGDALFTLSPVAGFYASRSELLTAEAFDSTADLRMLLTKENSRLAERLSGVIRRFRENGTIDDLYETWVTAYTETGRPESADDIPELPLFATTSDGEIPETIRVGVSGTLPLVDYLVEDGVAGGFTAAFWAAIATELESNVVFVSVLPESKNAALIDDRIDVYFWHFLDVPDIFIATEPYLTVNYAFLNAE